MRSEPKASEIWLGGRDSNPDTVVQSHVSYRWTTSQYQREAVRAGNTDYSLNQSRSVTLTPRADTGTRLSQVVAADIARHRLLADARSALLT